MSENAAMLKEVAQRTALAVIGVAVLSPGPSRLRAQESHWPAVQSQMLVSTSWLEQHLNDRDLVVLYVGRDRSQFEVGHIPGSRFVRLDDLVEQHKDSLNELPPVADLQATFESLGVGDQSRIVLTGDALGMLAARVYFTLDYLGHADDVSLLEGGTEKWVAELRATSKEQAHPERAHFTPHLRPEILISTAQMHDLSSQISKGASNVVLLDARPVAEYNGNVKSEAVPKAGHIAGAESVYWKKLIRSDADPRLLPVDELRQQFLSAGATHGKSVITYCRTGMQSSFAYFVAKYLGYDAAMYDGSIYEWVHAADNNLVVSPGVERGSTAHQ
jgi:thiosulfate/3-mercaptopyruvate sulfurtransferase